MRHSRLMTKHFKELQMPITSSSLLPCNHHYNHGGLFHVHLGATFSPAAGFPEFDIPIPSLLSKFFPATVLCTLPLPVSAVPGQVKLARSTG